MADGDTVRTIVKFLSHEQSKEREEAVSLLYELSKSETLCEKIGSIPGAILMLVGMTSSKSDNILTVEKADKTLENLEKCENNVLQMAENGRLQPLLTQILEGTCTFFSLYSSLNVLLNVGHQTGNTRWLICFTFIHGPHGCEHFPFLFFCEKDQTTEGGESKMCKPMLKLYPHQLAYEQ